MKTPKQMFLFLSLLAIWSGTSNAEPKYRPFLDEPEAYTPPTESQKQWALATCAVLTQSNGRRHDILGGCDRSPKEIKAWQESLAKWWNTHDREDLIKALEWIEQGGHRREFDTIAHDLSAASPEQLVLIRKMVVNNPSVSNKVEIVMQYKDTFGKKSITAWDFSRYVSLCGWGYIAGYLTEDEAWMKIMPAARLLQKTFTSWEDLGENHVVGREFWSLKQTQTNGEKTRRCFEKLKTDAASPWKRLDWDSDLSPSGVKSLPSENAPSPPSNS